MNAIRAHAVSKSRGTARKSVSVLRGVSFSISAGELVLLAGPSGSGKTTLLGIAAGLLTPDAGEVEIRGVLINQVAPSERRALRAAAIGIVFQRPSLLSGLTARENIRLMASVAGMCSRDAQSQTTSLLERLGISALADRLPHELSGGEEQRVGVARALVHRPAVIIADEPTANLDTATGESIAEILASLATERQTAVLVATHDLRLRRFASRCLHLENGTLSEEHLRHPFSRTSSEAVR